MGNRVVPLFSKFLYINISLFHEPMIQSVIAFISKRDIEVLYLFLVFRICPAFKWFYINKTNTLQILGFLLVLYPSVQKVRQVQK